MLKTSFQIAATVALLLGCAFPAATLRAGVVDVTLSVSLDDPRPLADMLDLVGRHYDVFFTYDAELVSGQTVDFALRADEELPAAVERLLALTGLGFESFGDKYFVLFADNRRGRRDANRLRRKVRQLDRLEQRHNSELHRADRPAADQLSRVADRAEALTAARLVSGRVVDATGEALTGVAIRVVGTDQGVLTDRNGNFRLPLATTTARLTCSYVGFANEEVAVRRGGRVRIQLRPAETELPEVVIIGYGEVSAAAATSSIDRIEAGALNTAQTINTPHQWLQGKVAGVQVQGGNGEQGSFGSIRIRGASSMNASNEPLFVVDGMPVDNNPHAPGGLQPGRNPLNSLNPSDVASVTVLKDAAAGAIYGSRAANGVVLIETKRGQLFQQGQLSYGSWVSVGEAADRLAVHDAAGFRRLVREVAPDRVSELGTADTDWQDVILQTAVSQQHNLSYAAGGERSAYRVSAGYLDRNSISVGAGSQRYSLAVNGKHQAWQRQLTLTADVKLSHLRDRFVSPAIFGYAYAFNPTLPVYEPGNRWGGYFEYTNDLTIKNPLGEAEQVRDEGRLVRVLAHAKTSFAPAAAPGLKATVYVGTDRTDGHRNLYAPATVRYQFASQGEYRLAGKQRRSHLWESYLNYDRRLAADRLGLALTAGYTYQHARGDYPEERYGGVDDYAYAFARPPVGQRPARTVSSAENRLASFFGRGSFDWAGRYYLTASFRTDGSSRFSPDNRWANFPAVSAAWRLSEEPFLANRPAWVGALKLRAGWGITGNQEIGDFQYLPTFTTGGRAVSFPFGDDYLITARPNAVSDRLKWEQTTSVNLGLEASFFSDRLTTTVEAYRSVTTDLLSRVVVPAGSNLSDVVLTNVGSIRNRGWELSLNARLIEGRDWTWSVSANVATNDNEVLSLGPAPDRNFRAISTGTITGGTGNTIQIYQEGAPLNAFYVFAHKRDAAGRPLRDGVDHNQDGMIDLADRYADLDGNGRVDDRDKRAFRAPAPRVFGGVQSSLRWRAWGVHTALRAQAGNYVYNNNAAVAESYDRILNEAELLNVPLRVTDYGFRAPQLFSDVFIEDASFLRMDALTVDYQLAAAKKRPAARLYATLRNVFTLTAYRGLDPEIGNVSGNPNVPRFGIDDLLFPRARTFVAGLNLDF